MENAVLILLFVYHKRADLQDAASIGGVRGVRGVVDFPAGQTPSHLVLDVVELNLPRGHVWQTEVSPAAPALGPSPGPQTVVEEQVERSESTMKFAGQSVAQSSGESWRVCDVAGSER